MKSRISAIAIATLAACLLTALTLAGAASQTKHPDLSGTWKMNSEKSKFERGGPEGITIKFDHKDPALAETLMLSGGGGDRSLDLKYTTDGKETTQELMGQTGQTLARWEGDSLWIEWKADGRSFNRKLTLSPDGKTITMIVKQSSPDGGATDTVVLEKQETK